MHSQAAKQVNRFGQMFGVLHTCKLSQARQRCAQVLKAATCMLSQIPNLMPQTWTKQTNMHKPCTHETKEEMFGDRLAVIMPALSIFRKTLCNLPGTLDVCITKHLQDSKAVTNQPQPAHLQPSVTTGTASTRSFETCQTNSKQATLDKCRLAHVPQSTRHSRQLVSRRSCCQCKS